MARVNRSVAAILLAGIVGLPACDAAAPDQPPDVDFRCLDVADNITPIGLIGLHFAEVSGTPTIAGPAASVFSNNLVALSQDYDLHGDAIGGGHVTIDGSVMPRGDVIKGAGTITVADPSAEVAAAQLVNDNHTIPCVPQNDSCVSPLSGYDLAISDVAVTLSSGTYYFESISVNGIGRLNIDGDVVVYLNGPATFNGGSATNPNSDTLTLVSASTDEIKLNGVAESEMSIYAPMATVRFSGTQGFNGWAVAYILRISGTADLNVTTDVPLELGLNCPDPDGPTELPEIPN